MIRLSVMLTSIEGVERRASEEFKDVFAAAVALAAYLNDFSSGWTRRLEFTAVVDDKTTLWTGLLHNYNGHHN